MVVSITDCNITENYEDLTILREAELNAAMSSIEACLNTDGFRNIEQVSLDVFGNTYTLNSDGNQTEATPLKEAAALLADNETITGDWTFEGNVTFSGSVSSSDSFSSSGQPRARAYLTSANQTISNNTITSINMAAETYDVGDVHDNGTNTERMTIPSGEGGVYLFDAQVTFESTTEKKVLVFTGDFVASNTIDLKINGTSITTTNFNSDNATTLSDLATNIAANADVASATDDGYHGIVIQAVDNDTRIDITDITVAGGATNATGYIVQQEDSVREIYLYKNGSEIAKRKLLFPDGGEDLVLNIQAHDNASASDYYDIRVYQDTGSDLDVILGERKTYFSTIKVW